MYTIIKNGVETKVNYCGKDAQKRMISNGWRIELQDNSNESEQALYDRLEATGNYTDIKIYYNTTMIRGYHKFFAMVKR